MAKAGANVITELKPRITVIGVGGAGCNAINNMIATGLGGVNYVAANTDAQALALSSAEQRLQLGVTLTEGLGAGSKPEIGEAAAEEAVAEIRRYVEGSHMVFIAAGMGGGTGTGAASVIARIARETGALTVAIVSKPFHFEGTRRMRIAMQGIEQLRGAVDTLIVIPNQNLFRLATNRTTFAEAFVMADQVLYSGIACIVDLILKDGLINLDFADVRTIMSGMGTAVMGTGEASGERRATIAAEEAISNPLLEDLTLAGARGVLLSIIGGPDLTLYEVDEAASRVRKEVDPDANIIVGATFDPALGERVRVSIVATGMGLAVSAAAPKSEALPVTTAAPPQPPPLAAQHTYSSSNSVAPGAGASPAPPSPPSPPSRAPSAVASPALPSESLRAPGSPPPPPRTTGGDPYLGDTNAEDFARALSAALADAPAPPRPAPSSAHREVWQGPDGVTIEAGAGLRIPLTASAEIQSSEPAVTSPAFVPGAPAAIPRSPVRMPAVDEFPVVGQRAYYGQRGTPHAEPSTSVPQSEAASIPASAAGSRDSDRQSGRRPNLLERITGMRGRGDSAEPAASGYPQEGRSRPQDSRGNATESHAAAAKPTRNRT